MSTETERNRSGSADGRANSTGNADYRGPYGYGRRAHGSDPRAQYGFAAQRHGS